MIGFSQRHSYEDSATRFTGRLRDGLPIDIVSNLDRMEYNQLLPWSEDDGKMWAAVYFVLKGQKNDTVLMVDAICEDEPIIDQIQTCWDEFKRLFPRIMQRVDAGHAVVALQFER